MQICTDRDRVDGRLISTESAGLFRVYLKKTTQKLVQNMRFDNSKRTVRGEPSKMNRWRRLIAYAIPAADVLRLDDAGHYRTL